MHFNPEIYYKPENFQSLDDYEEFLMLVMEAEEIFPELSEPEIVEVVENFMAFKNK